MADLRFRNFATIVYPESAAPDWREILSGLHVPCFISPLHDQDVLPDGTLKKPHFHVLLMFEGKQSPESVQKLWDMIHGVGSERVLSIRGYARYLCHLDNPEKAQYSQSDVICYGGSDYYETIHLITDKYYLMLEVLQFFADNPEIRSYAQLVDYAAQENLTYFRIVADHSIFFREYLRSKYR